MRLLQFNNPHNCLYYNPHNSSFLEWRRKFGDVYTFWMGEQPVVCVASYEKMVETFQKDAEAYTGRINFPEFDRIIKGKQKKRCILKELEVSDVYNRCVCVCVLILLESDCYI